MRMIPTACGNQRRGALMLSSVVFVQPIVQLRRSGQADRECDTAEENGGDERMERARSPAAETKSHGDTLRHKRSAGNLDYATLQ